MIPLSKDIKQDLNRRHGPVFHTPFKQSYQRVRQIYETAVCKGNKFNRFSAINFNLSDHDRKDNRILARQTPIRKGQG